MRHHRERRYIWSTWILVIGWVVASSMILSAPSLQAADDASPVVTPVSIPTDVATTIPPTRVPREEPTSEATSSDPTLAPTSAPTAITSTEPHVQAAANTATISPHPTQLVAGEAVTWTMTVTGDEYVPSALIRFYWGATILVDPTCTGNLWSCETNPGPGYVNANAMGPLDPRVAANGTLTVTVLTPGPGTYTVSTICANCTEDSVTFEVVDAPTAVPTAVPGTVDYAFDASTYQLPVGGTFTSILTMTLTGAIPTRSVTVGSDLGRANSISATLTPTGDAVCTLTDSITYVTATIASTAGGTCVLTSTWEDNGPRLSDEDSLVVGEMVGSSGRTVAIAGVEFIVPTPAPTDTPQPTDTPMPTNTPTNVPTDTPVPTSTPVGTTSYAFDASTYQLPVGGTFTSNLTVTLTGAISARSVTIAPSFGGVRSISATLTATGDAVCTLTASVPSVRATIASTAGGTCVLTSTWEAYGPRSSDEDVLDAIEWIGSSGRSVASAGVEFITQTPAPTETPQPTDTPMPTNTPTNVPTDTPVPTNTPVPTDTPMPTNTPTNVPTDTPVPTPTPVGATSYAFDASIYQLPVGGTFTSNLTMTLTGAIPEQSVTVGPELGRVRSTSATLTATGDAVCTLVTSTPRITARIASTAGGTCVLTSTWLDNGPMFPDEGNLTATEWIGNAGHVVASAIIDLIPPTPVPSETPQPTDTPAPTNTPTTTATSTPHATVPPTATSTPDPSPTSTVTPTSGPVSSLPNTGGPGASQTEMRMHTLPLLLLILASAGLQAIGVVLIRRRRSSMR